MSNLKTSSRTPFLSDTDKLEFLPRSEGGMAFVMRNSAIWWYFFAMPACAHVSFGVTKARLAHSVQGFVRSYVPGTVVGAGIQQGTRTLLPWILHSSERG